MAGEFDFIAWVRSQQKPSELVKLPAGDDLAVLKWPADELLLVGVDQVLDGVHFDSAVHPPRAIGRKAMNRNLSDCAAMGCLPAAAVVSVAAKKGTPLVFLQELYAGIREAGEAHSCQIVGGDTGSWDGKLVVTVTILGRSAGVQPVTRKGAKPDDLIYVTGPLGGSMLGRHMTFEPRVGMGHALAMSGVSAMIDLSDGLSRDLRHICEQSGVGATIYAENIPVHDDAVEMRRDGHTPLEHALHDGEDYELLLTAPPTLRGLFLIGIITASPGIFLLERDGTLQPLDPKGWEHTL
jgi:thiamine-monophosphate kinase